MKKHIHQLIVAVALATCPNHVIFGVASTIASGLLDFKPARLKVI